MKKEEKEIIIKWLEDLVSQGWNWNISKFLKWQIVKLSSDDP